MNYDEFLAMADASYEIERVRNESIRYARFMLGDAYAKDMWRLAWIIGHQAGLEVAKEIHDRTT